MALVALWLLVELHGEEKILAMDPCELETAWKAGLIPDPLLHNPDVPATFGA